ncbi:MAG: ParB/RepB/Spo0J family partition protein [Limnochordia bacterium]|jgi:ParB family chromosome partitioning protein
MQIIQIPLSLVQEDPQHVRLSSDPKGIENLAKSMNDVGLLHPILVRKVAHGYQLVAGQRRLRAASRLGYESVPAIVLEPGVPVRQVQLVENLQREDLDPVERALAINQFMMAEKLTKVAAAERLGVPRTTLTEWLNVLEVPERYQKALVENFRGGDSALTVSHVSEAKGLASRLRSPGLCTIVLDAVLDYRLSKAETREVCALVRESMDLSVDEAVLVVRRPSEISRLSDDLGDGRLAVERNLDRWRYALERSTTTLLELGRISPRYLAPNERRRLVDRLQHLQELVEGALQQMAEERDVRRAGKVS